LQRKNRLEGAFALKKGTYIIENTQQIAKNTYRTRLKGDTSAIVAPGQFVNIALAGSFLRRPLSVCDWDEKGLWVIYKTVGKGTSALSKLEPGQKLDLLTGLGNGFDMELAGSRPMLIGGGVGVPPLYGLAKRLMKQGVRPLAILGFNTAEEVFYEKEFAELGCDVVVATVDGSYGQKGFVTDAMPQEGTTFFYACGPEPMLKAVYHRTNTSGQLSFEEHMGCGFGACMGCACRTKYGVKRICKDGPVLMKEEVVW
jgi:dihydroorotate dehydrogenase electron transfer subunit